MSLQVEPTQHHEEELLPPSGLDERPGIVPAPVQPAHNGPGRVVMGISLAIGLFLWLVLDVHIALTAVVTFLLYLVVTYLTYRFTSGHRQALNRVMTGLVSGAFVLAVLPLVSLLWTVVANGLGTLIQPSFLSTSMNGVTGVHDRAMMEDGGPLIGGAYHAIVGTLIITGIATLISVPIGMFTAIYLVEYGATHRISHAIRFLVDVMTGIPSIVAGLFAYALFSSLFGPGTKNGIAGAIALSVLMIPTVVRNSEEMLRIVPNELREAALALGVPKWRVILKVVLPTAASGLASGVTLAIARVIGETAPLLVAVGYFRAINTNPFEGPMNTLAVYAYWMFMKPLNPGYPEPSLDRAWAAALMLLLIVVLLNLLARIIAKIFAPKTGR